MQSKFVYYYFKLFDSKFKKVELQKLSFKSLTINDIVDIYAQSEIVLDINHPSQRGLTMRTFEVLGAKRKLITTNKHIKNYNFYNQNNILVIDREDIDLDFNFFKNSFQEYSKDIYDMYSIDGWLQSLFFKNENSFVN